MTDRIASECYWERFWTKVDKSGDCWIWTAARSHGYGHFWVGGKVCEAHRIAYELLVGPIPEGLTIDHLCRNRACVNPAHMEPVTNRENVLRGEGLSAIGARRTHCAKGHEYTPENTHHPKNRPTERRCRKCSRRWVREGSRRRNNVPPSKWKVLDDE